MRCQVRSLHRLVQRARPRLCLLSQARHDPRSLDEGIDVSSLRYCFLFRRRRVPGGGEQLRRERRWPGWVEVIRHGAGVTEAQVARVALWCEGHILRHASMLTAGRASQEARRNSSLPLLLLLLLHPLAATPAFLYLQQAGIHQ